MAKLSVIVCVYNTNEKLFEECLKSIESSSFKDIELVIVDDGSTVDYSKILKKFKTAKYFKTENQGTLKARLLGISKATSPYVCFVDSDDTVSKLYYEALMKNAEKTNADIVFGDWAFHTQQTKYYCGNDSCIKTNFCHTNEGVLSSFFKQKGKEHSYYVLWNKIFKKEVLSNTKKEIEKLNLGSLVFAEDVLITYFAFKNASKITNTHLGYYFYRIHDSQEITVNSAAKLENHIRSMANVFNLMEADLKLIGRFDEVEFFFNEWKKLLCRTGYSNAKQGGHKHLFPVLKECYNISKLKKAKLSDSSAYTKQKILPNNMEEINAAIQKIYYSKKTLFVCVKKKSYAHNTLVKMQNVLGTKFNITPSTIGANIVMPEEVYSIKQKILHNDAVYLLGVILFPKGSKIRKKLKSKL